MTNRFLADLIGYTSTICICVTLLPQIVQILRTRSVSGLSLPTYLIYDVGNAAGLVYGFAINSAPVTATSIITLMTSSFVTVLILRNRVQRKKEPPSDASFIEIAAALAYLCPRSDSAFAVGAIITDSTGAIVSTGYSREWGDGWHAEEVAIAKAQRRGLDLTPTTIYSSLEPCAERKSRPLPCVSVIRDAGIKRVVYGVSEPPLFASGNGAQTLRDFGANVRQVDGAATAFEAANFHVAESEVIDYFAALFNMGIQQFCIDGGAPSYRVASIHPSGLTAPRVVASPFFQTREELRQFCFANLDAARSINKVWRETHTFPKEIFAEWAATWSGSGAIEGVATA